MVAHVCSFTGKIRGDEEGSSLKKLSLSSSLDFDHIQISINWEDVTCPICLDFPHNGVLLQCSSYDNGCRPFMCDTDQTHSNCLTRFKSASGMPQAVECLIMSDASRESTRVIPSTCESRPACPLCRGEVIGWVIVKEARAYLNTKKRCCQEKHCNFTGNFVELQHHVLLKHPHSHPSEIDPARQLDWESFQQSSDIIDVLSTIHAEVPHGVVLGDYVIEYGDDDDGDDYDDFHGRGAKWWTSCILHQVFGKFRCSGNRRRSRGDNLRRDHVRSSSNGSNEGSPSSVDTAVYRFRQTEDGADDPAVASRGAIDHHTHRHVLPLPPVLFSYACVLVKEFHAIIDDFDPEVTLADFETLELSEEYGLLDTAPTTHHNLELSCFSVGGISGPQTMKLSGKLCDRPILIMVDSGASHNFLSAQLAHQFSHPLVPSTNFTVCLGDGHRRPTQVCCTAVSLLVGPCLVTVDFHAFGLDGINAILGVA